MVAAVALGARAQSASGVPEKSPFVTVNACDAPTAAMAAPDSLPEATSTLTQGGILRRLEFHYTPKHASWLNMVEIEIGVMVDQCLDRRIPDKRTLVREPAAWQRRRNLERARIKWLFTVERAREKMGRAYPGRAPRLAALAA